MAQKISKKEEILTRLSQEGKIEILDQQNDQQKVLEMNDRMQEIRREYQIKERQSQMTASKVILTS